MNKNVRAMFAPDYVPASMRDPIISARDGGLVLMLLLVAGWLWAGYQVFDKLGEMSGRRIMELSDGVDDMVHGL